MMGRVRRFVPIGLLVAAACAIAAVVGVSLREPPRPGRRVVARVVDARAPLAALTQQGYLLRFFSGDLGRLVEHVVPRDPYELRVDELVRDGVTLRSVLIRRQGEAIAAQATLDPAALASVAPAGVRLHYAAQDDGSVVLEGKAEKFGLSVPVSVRVEAQDGRVVAQPQGVPIDPVTLFDDPRLLVNAVSARPGAGGKVTLRAEGRLVAVTG